MLRVLCHGGYTAAPPSSLARFQAFERTMAANARGALAVVSRCRSTAVASIRKDEANVGYMGLKKVNHNYKKTPIKKVKGLPRAKNSPEVPTEVDKSKLNIANPGVIRYKPTTPARRGMIVMDKSGLSSEGPFRPLTYGQAASGGRSSQTGRMTVRHRQGRAQRRLVRTVDFIRSARLNVPCKVVRVEHDPARSGLLALVKYGEPLPAVEKKVAGALDSDGLPEGFWGTAYNKDDLEANLEEGSSISQDHENTAQGVVSTEEVAEVTPEVSDEESDVMDIVKTYSSTSGQNAIGSAKSEHKIYKDYAYILCPQGLAPGMEIVASRSKSVPVLPGNATLLAFMRPGSVIHNVEIKPGKGGQLIRSAGSWGTILGKDEAKGFAIVRITSKTQMRVRLDCMATYGKVSNPEHHNQTIGSAGRNRRMGRRPKVRGIAMNPCDHPHGGKGTGKVNDMTRWGKRGKGWKTVRNQKRKAGGIHGNIIWRHIANRKQAGQVKKQ